MSRAASLATTPPKAARLVADALKERILAGEYVPGDFLPPVDDLLAEFGVSRPTLREALNLLEAAGFVRLRRGPGGGTEVRAPDHGEIVRALEALLRFEQTEAEDLMEVRLVLEPAAVRLAAQRATDEAIAVLAEILERQKDPDVLRDPRRWFAEKLEFHRQIAVMSGNPVFRVLTDSLRDLTLQANLDADYTLQNRKESLRQQAEVVRRLQARDAKGAESALRRHLRKSHLLRSDV